jgi:hypothetical protein
MPCTATNLVCPLNYSSIFFNAEEGFFCRTTGVSLCYRRDTVILECARACAILDRNVKGVDRVCLNETSSRVRGVRGGLGFGDSRPAVSCSHDHSCLSAFLAFSFFALSSLQLNFVYF